jgi:HlyD family secretion protein
MTPKTRRIAAAAVVALALAGGAVWWLWFRTQDTGTLTFAGNVEVRQVNLGFKVGGRIAKLNVDEGDKVAENQPLGTLDRVYFDNALAQMRAQREQAAATLAKLEAGNRPEEIAQSEAAVAEREATLANARVNLARYERLVQEQAESRAAYDNMVEAYRQADARAVSARQALQVMRLGPRKEDIAAARAQLADREAALKAAELNLSDAALKAPGPGVVLSRVREAGAIVGPGETVFVLSLTRPVWIRTYVSEVDLGRIRPGMKVSVTRDTPGTTPLTGRIGFISTTAEFTPKTIETRDLRTSLVYRLRVVIDDPGDTLRQGMPVTVTIPIAARPH